MIAWHERAVQEEFGVGRHKHAQHVAVCVSNSRRVLFQGAFFYLVFFE